MAMENQIAANRANAKKSTGPKTAAGRSKSSRNALRHGLSLPLRLDTESYEKADAPHAQALRLTNIGNSGWVAVFVKTNPILICSWPRPEPLPAPPGSSSSTKTGEGLACDCEINRSQVEEEVIARPRTAASQRN